MEKGQVAKIIAGLIVVFALFQWASSTLESTRGEYGVIVGMIVVAALVMVQRLAFCKSVWRALLSLGLGIPNARSLASTALIGSIMLSSLFLFVDQTGSTLDVYPDWESLIIGLFFQAGIAEETLFRGYLFGHIRRRHTFWKAASFAAIPFVLIHLNLFFSLDWSLAGASILLSVAISFPLSTLYEQNGNTIWAPALLHFIIQAVPKLVVPNGDSAWLFPLFWILISAIVPLFVYTWPFRHPSEKVL